jgi:hypothetical protein
MTRLLQRTLFLLGITACFSMAISAQRDDPKKPPPKEKPPVVTPQPKNPPPKEEPKKPKKPDFASAAVFASLKTWES